MYTLPVINSEVSAIPAKGVKKRQAGPFPWVMLTGMSEDAVSEIGHGWLMPSRIYPGIHPKFPVSLINRASQPILFL